MKKFKTIITYATIGVLCLNNFNSIFAEDESTTLDTNTENTIETPLIIDEEDSLHKEDQADTNLDEDSNNASDEENLEENTEDQEVHQNENQENENNTESDETLTQGQEASDEEDESNNHDESNENNESNEDHNSSEDVESNGTNDTNSDGDENTEDSKDSEDPENTDNQDNTEENLNPEIDKNTGNTSGEGQNQNGDEDENQDEDQAPLFLQSPQRNLLANPLRNSPTTFTFETITITKPASYTGEGPEKIVIMDRNLGATSNDITSPDSYGNYYQWGNNYGFNSSEAISYVKEGLVWDEAYDKHGYYNTGFIRPTSTRDEDVWEDGTYHDGVWGGSNDSSANNYGLDNILDTQQDRQGPCPTGYHVPSIGEWSYLLTYRSFTNNNNDFATTLKLPLAGSNYFSETAIDFQQIEGRYWSSSPYSSPIAHAAYILSLPISTNNLYQEHRLNAISVRCFKNYDPINTSSKFTLTFDSNGGSTVDSVTIESGTLLKDYRPQDPVYNHHMLLGWFDENDQRVSFERTVITGDMTLTAKWAYFEDITYTGVIGGTGIAITLMDRNLGATSNNINDPSSDGYYYQYGNNYGFEREKIFNHETPITTGQANISGYGIDHPYYGESFYWNTNTNKFNWATSTPHALWGGGGDKGENDFDDGNARESRQGPCPEGYHIPSLKEVDTLINLFGGNNGISTISNGGFNYPAYVGKTDNAKIVLNNDEYQSFLTTFKLPMAGRIASTGTSDTNRYRDPKKRAQFFSHVSSASSERNADRCTSFQTNNDSSKGIYLNNGGRIDEKLTFAFPIRCFRNTAILPLQTVTRQDDEGNLITTGTVEFGKIPEFQGGTPTKTSTPEFTYTFSGRTPTPTSATGDVTYTALFDTGIKRYEIIFQDNNGNTISTKEYEYGTPVDQIEIPNITITGGTFIRWDPTLTGVTTGMTYTPIYTLDTYTLTYELNSGVNHLDNPTTYTIESGDITLQEPTRTGYHFAGWTESGSTTFLTGIPQGTTGDKTLIAHWDPKTVHITLDFQGGTGGTSDFYFSFDTKKYYTDSSLTHEITTITKPSKAGYTFQDFYSNNIGERFVSYEKNGTRIELNHEDEDTYYRISDDTTLIARWEPKIIHITLDPQGGTGGTQAFWFKYQTPQFYSDQALTEELTKIIRPTRTGYTFMNYKTEQERYVAYEDNGILIEFADDLHEDLYNDTVLKATWEANDYRIHFVNSDHPSEEVVVAMKYDQDFLIPEAPFTKTGYTFKGWETEQGQLFQVGTSVRNLATTGDVLLKTKREEIPKRSFGSSGGLRLQKDYCPKGDFSDSYYDNTCEKSIKKDEKSDDIHGAADDEETNQLYEWAKETELTSTENVDTFRLDAPLTRSEMAKIVSIFLQKFLGQFADPDIRCTQFTDIAGITSDLHDYIIEACNLGIMGRTSDGEGVNKTFTPHNKVTKAEAVTILSRLFWGNTYQPQAKQQWYENHLNHLIQLGVITDSQNLNIPFTRREFYTALYEIYV